MAANKLKDAVNRFLKIDPNRDQHNWKRFTKQIPEYVNSVIKKNLDSHGNAYRCQEETYQCTRCFAFRTIIGEYLGDAPIDSEHFSVYVVNKKQVNVNGWQAPKCHKAPSKPKQ